MGETGVSEPKIQRTVKCVSFSYSAQISTHFVPNQFAQPFCYSSSKDAANKQNQWKISKGFLGIEQKRNQSVIG